MTVKLNNSVQNINSRLSVQVSLTGLSFFAADLETKETLHFSEKKFSERLTPEELLIEIERIISNSETLNRKFSEVFIIYSNKMYALVPLPLFEESRASEYLKFNSKILATDYIAHDLLEKHDIAVVYVPLVNINNYFFEKYGSFQYYHGTTVLLKSILNIERHSIVSKVYLHLRKEEVDCILIDNASLQLCNTYSFKTPEDLVYYILFCLEQKNLDPNEIPVYLSGDIEKGDANYEILYTYIRKLAFVKNEFSLTNEESHNNFLINSNFL